MMTSSNGNIFRVTGPLCGGFTGHPWIPAQRPVTRSFDVFFGLRLNKWLSKQLWGWWFEAPSRSLWRHCNDKQSPKSMTMITKSTDAFRWVVCGYCLYAHKIWGTMCPAPCINVIARQWKIIDIQYTQLVLASSRCIVVLVMERVITAMIYRNITDYLNTGCTVKPVCNDHLYNKIYYLWFI